MRIARVLRFSLLLVVGVHPALADGFGSFYVIPAAAHVSGGFGSAWRTDVSIHNFQTSPVTIEMAVIESGEGMVENVFPLQISGSATLTVPAGRSMVLTDVLAGHRGKSEVSGAIIIGGDRAFAVTTRTYSLVTGGGTVGQTVTPVSQFVASAPGSVAFAPGAVANGRFRSNIGFVAGAATNSNGPLVVEVTLRGADGSILGQRSFSTAPGGFMHLQFSSALLTNSTFDAGTVSFRISAGSGSLGGYVSVVDNTTNDASFVKAEMPIESGPSSIFANVLTTYR